MYRDEFFNLKPMYTIALEKYDSAQSEWGRMNLFVFIKMVQTYKIYTYKICSIESNFFIR